jgi:hypothetical protein
MNRFTCYFWSLETDGDDGDDDDDDDDADDDKIGLTVARPEMPSNRRGSV